MSKLKLHQNFTVIPNELLSDCNISFKAKGLYAYLNSKPDGWDFTILGIASQNKEGKNAIETALKELKDNGWLIIHNYQNEKGQWDSEYELFISPLAPVKGENPTTEKPYTENPTTEKPYTNKERKSKTEKVKRLEVGDKPKIQIIDKLFELLPELDGMPHVSYILRALERRNDKWEEYLTFIVRQKRDRILELKGWDDWFWKDYISYSYRPKQELEAETWTEEELERLKKADINPYGTGHWNDQFKNNTLSTGE